MGERLLRPGIRTSDRTAANIRDGGWMAQVFYDWLITVVDDFGRTDARPAILRVEVFPLLLDMVRESDVERCLKSCQTAGLIRLYTCDGKPYLEIPNFKQRLRAKRSKCPPPPDAVHCRDNDMTMPSDTETDTETDNKSPRNVVIPESLNTPEFMEAWREWLKHRRERKQSVTPTTAEYQIKQLVKMGLKRALAAIDHSITKGYQGIYEPNGQYANNSKQRQRSMVAAKGREDD